MSDIASLQRQSNRLRFEEPALEAAFRDERVAGARTRSRALLIVGILAAAWIGYSEARFVSVRSVDFHLMNLQLRFFGMAPAWMLLLLSTFFPGHRRRSEWLEPVCTIVACWALALIYWHVALLFPKTDISNAAAGGMLTLLLISAVALPMRFPALCWVAFAILAGPYFFYLATLPGERITELHLMGITFAGVGAVVLFLAWYREAADRLMFAQREFVKRLNTELARLNAEKNEFIAIASHDLRSPLATVHGLAGQLEEGRWKDPQQAHTAIRELARQMLALVNNYLGAHATEHGALPVTLMRVDLQALAAEMAQRHGPMAQLKQQQIEAGSGPPVWVQADPALLGQVMDNFVSNAVKFSLPGARVTLEVLVAEDGSRARLAVLDEGPGIAPDDQAGLFRKYYRATPQPTGGEASHGLGLAVSKRLAEAMGGAVGCDSPIHAAGTGARFWVELPAS